MDFARVLRKNSLQADGGAEPLGGRWSTERSHKSRIMVPPAVTACSTRRDVRLVKSEGDASGKRLQVEMDNCVQPAVVRCSVQERGEWRM